MKKRIVWLVVCLCLTLCACAGGNIENVKTTQKTSEVYTEAEIAEAIEVAKTYFAKEFKGCTLTEIGYMGDEYIKPNQDFATRHDLDEVIVLISKFDVDASGGDGSLNPNSEYVGWQWILARNKGGKWRHVDHGY